MQNAKPFKFRHLRTRITVYFSVLTMICFFVFTIVIINAYSSKLVEETDSVQIRELSLMENRLSEKIEQVEATHSRIMCNAEILKILSRSNAQGELSTEDTEALNYSLDAFIGNSYTIRTGLMLNGKGSVLQPIYKSFAGRILENREYVRLQSSQLTRIFSESNDFPLITNAGDNAISYFGKIYDCNDQYAQVGTLMLQIRKNQLFKDLDEQARQLFSLCLVVNENGEIVSSFGNPVNAEEQESLIDALKASGYRLQDNEYRMYSTKVSAYPVWRLICLQSNLFFTQRFDSLTWLVVFASAIFILLVIANSILLSEKITRPLNSLRDSMNRLGTATETRRWPEPLTTERRDEIFDLINGYNSMLANLRHLTDENEFRLKREKEAEINALQMKLDMLQLQINPHFIHNTLISMQYIAHEAGVPKLVTMISAFNSLLRNSFAHSGLYITALEEVENLKNYIKVQQPRYDFPIEFIDEVEPDLVFAEIPKLILQPLVENALFHGLLPVRGGTIIVTFEKVGDRMEVRISDNGVGITNEKLQEFTDSGFSNPKGYNSFGMKNVNERLELTYGSESCLHIQRGEKGGTVIRFIIPIHLKF